MDAAETPSSWPLPAKAEVVLRVIHEAIQHLANPRWYAATGAAFRFPSEDYQGTDADSLAGRWRTLARKEGATESQLEVFTERYRGYWTTAAPHLAEAVNRRFDELNRSNSDWHSFWPEGAHPTHGPLQLAFDRTDVLYQFDGRRGVSSTSYRWLTAQGPIDHYEAVGWYFSDPDAEVEITALANCSVDGAPRDLPQGGRSATLKFSHTLEPGEQYFFAYQATFNSDRPCRPTILYEVRGLVMRSLTLRAQFDQSNIPSRAWHFDVGMQGEGSAVPDDDAPEILRIASNGYVSHEFDLCERGRTYGLRWIWSDDDSAVGGPNTVELKGGPSNG